MQESGISTRSRYSIDVQKLYERLNEVEVGVFVSYLELNKTIRSNVQQEGYAALGRARRILAKEGKEFKTLRGEGLRRATNEDCQELAESGISRTRAVARRSLLALENLPNPGSLGKLELASVIAKQTIFGLTLMVTKPSRRKSLEGELEKNPALTLESIRARLLDS